MSVDSLYFKKEFNSESNLIDIIFIHGLDGDPQKTWESITVSGTKEFWPLWLSEKFPLINIYSLGYPASFFKKWAKEEMNIFERADSILEHLVANGLGKKPIIFITHSLGGILTKQILQSANNSTNPDWNNLCKMTKMVAFLATPHSGASLAAIGSLISNSSTFIKLLSNKDGYLTNLNHDYREFAPELKIKTVVYYEKHKTKGVVGIVNQLSADPGVYETRPIAIEADHIGICKPENKESAVYMGLCYHIDKIYKASNNNEINLEACLFDIDDYLHPSEIDRRDLLKKLIDAGREHEYSIANDLQNKFAQKYYRLGLHSESKTQHDQLLADIEQSFNLHIYHGLICKNASYDEIAKSLQENVIDSVYEKHSVNATITHKTIMKALYFLTEQCHIRWDAENEF